MGFSRVYGTKYKIGLPSGTLLYCFTEGRGGEDFKNTSHVLYGDTTPQNPNLAPSSFVSHGPPSLLPARWPSPHYPPRTMVHSGALAFLLLSRILKTVGKRINPKTDSIPRNETLQKAHRSVRDVRDQSRVRNGG
jgi:hypothetical protein